jgi:hypothetical protein
VLDLDYVRGVTGLSLVECAVSETISAQRTNLPRFVSAQKPNRRPACHAAEQGKPRLVVPI